MTRNAPNSKSTNKYRAPGPSGSAHSCPLEVTREDCALTASGLADPRSARPTHVAVHFDGTSLSVAATSHSNWQQPVEGTISLPLDLSDPSALFPILEGKKPWKAWPEIEALVRQALVDLQIPRRMMIVIDRHLLVLRAVSNGPETSKMLRDLGSDKAGQKALFMQEDVKLDTKIGERVSHMHGILDQRSADPGILSAFSNSLRYYQELLKEKQRRESLTECERESEKRRRLEEAQRSRQRMKGAEARRT